MGSIHLSPVTSVRYPVDMPPDKAESSIGSRVLICPVTGGWSTLDAPFPTTELQSVSSLALRSPLPPGFSRYVLLPPLFRGSFLSPRSWWRASRTCAVNFRISVTGAREAFAISRASRTSSSLSVMPALSSSGSRCVYALVERSGSVRDRSISGFEGCAEGDEGKQLSAGGLHHSRTRRLRGGIKYYCHLDVRLWLVRQVRQSVNDAVVICNLLRFKFKLFYTRLGGHLGLLKIIADA